MTVLNFSDFARRAPVAAPSAQRHTDGHAPVTDRWAALHSPDQASVDTLDFWTALQLRLAYPTYQFQRR